MTKHLLFVSSHIADPQTIREGLNAETALLRYNADASMREITSQFLSFVHEAGVSTRSLDSIGWIFHGQKRSVLRLCGDTALYLKDLSATQAHWARLIRFVQLMKFYLRPDKNMVHLLACCLYRTPEFVPLAEKIKKETGIVLTASDDLTGNTRQNADWILESHDIDVKAMYFTDKIENYRFTFAKGVCHFLAGRCRE